MIKRIGYFCVLLSWVLLNPVQAANNVAKTYTVYVVPQFTPLEIYKTWAPLLEKLAQVSGLSFELKASPSIPAFEEVLASGKADFAFMNPYHLVVAKHQQGYIPLLRDSETLLAGILVVRKDSEIKQLQDLHNASIAFPAPNAFAASLLIRASFNKQQIPIVPSYVKSHSNVYRSVLLGDVAAGGGVNNTFIKESAELREQLQVLYTTPNYAPHPLAAHPAIPPAIREKVISSLLKMAADPEQAPLLQAVQIPKPVRANYATDYLPIEALQLQRLDQPGVD